jgi:hypothetical protein
LAPILDAVAPVDDPVVQDPVILDADPDEVLVIDEVGAADAVILPELQPRRGRKRKTQETDTVVSFLEHLNCDVGHPKVRGKKNRPCRLCGYVIKPLTAKQRKAHSVTSMEFLCCQKEAHIECWKVARKAVFATLECSSLTGLVNKTRTEVINVRAESGEETTDNVRNYVQCELCKKLLDVQKDNRNHIREECWGRLRRDRGGSSNDVVRLPSASKKNRVDELATLCDNLLGQQADENINPDSGRKKTRRNSGGDQGMPFDRGKVSIERGVT